MLGLLLNYVGICPNVKRIWTPTWVIFSGGMCYLLLAFFYWTIDVLQQGKYAKWLMVIGMNSIAAYVMAHTVDSYISKQLFTHLGRDYNTIFGLPYKTLVHGGLVLLFERLILNWMYNQVLPARQEILLCLQPHLQNRKYWLPLRYNLPMWL